MVDIVNWVLSKIYHPPGPPKDRARTADELTPKELREVSHNVSTVAMKVMATSSEVRRQADILKDLAERISKGQPINGQ